MLKPGTASLTNFVYTVTKGNKMLYTILGGFCFSLLSILLWSVDQSDLKNGFFIAFILILLGIGRAGYEGPVKGTYSDLYTGEY